MTGFPAIPPPNPAPAARPDDRVVLAIRGPGFGAETEPTPAADATALILVALLVFCVSWIVTMAALLKRRHQKQNLSKNLKLEAGTHSKSSEARPEWQKPGDWWKRD